MDGKRSGYWMSWYGHVLLGVALVVGFALSWGTAEVARATTTIVVNSTEDRLSTDGRCTLREAIIAANKDQASSGGAGECAAGSGADIITFDPAVFPADRPVTIILTRTDNGKEDSSSTGDLDVTSDVTISSQSPVTITAIDGFSDRILHILSGKVTISGVTISGGNVFGDGGGIYNKGSLTLSGVTLSGNKAGAKGGALYSAGSAARVTLTNVTISGNSSKTDGGGLFNAGGSAVLNNVTLADNTADSDANGTGDGGGIARSGGTVTVKNTLIAGNQDKSAATRYPDCSGTLASLGYNLLGNNAGCTFSPRAGDKVGTQSNPLDARLDALQNNGGPTFTHALRSGSPAIDAGTNDGCPATDQRGVARPQGPTCDIGAYEKLPPPSPPVVIRVILNASDTTIDGRLSGPANTPFTLSFFASATCDPASQLGTSVATTDGSGNVYFQATVNPVNSGQPVTATATDASGNTSVCSASVVAGLGNDSWPRALRLPLSGDPLAASVEHFIDTLGQSRWYKFTVQPNSQLIVMLTNLPANYDLTVYKDIAAAYQTLSSTQDLVRLGAEFAPSAFSPSAFSPSAFSPSAFSPDAFSPSAFSPSAFSPSAFSPSAFSPSAFSPSAFSPSAFSPSAFSPDAFSPSAFSPSAFSPSAFSPSAFSPDAFSPSAFSPSAFSSAQAQSLIGVSAFDGTAGEGLILNTWNHAGDFYVRVRGREGAFSLTAPFRLQVILMPGSCRNVTVTGLPDTSLAATAGNFKTLILTDLARMPDTPMDRLDTLAQRVAGVVVNVGADARVIQANAQADAHPECPYAKNVVADAIKQIVDRYRALNPSLEYVVIVGNDAVIPFFRYPDQALLGSESNYVPPVKDNTASQASLRLNYVLSQDAYGAPYAVSSLVNALPVPDLAVGRLVETVADINVMLDAYLSTNGGVAPTPTSSLVTGYDFLEDAAIAVQAELGAGIGAPPDTLITPRDLSPQDPAAWTADQLRAKLLDSRHDLIFLAGHFSANSALAADYRTILLTTDVTDSAVDLRNAIIFSAGCHSGYNIVNQDGVPGVTFEPDWAQAFASKGATLIAGTGYQYGDTDFIEYSERLYLEFSRQLRAGLGPVSVGQALVAAKRAYLASTPQLRGIHEKALLEATLFGLPMLSVDMPGARYTPPGDNSIVATTNGYSTNPGATLGLRSADVSIVPRFSEHVIQLKNTDDNSTLEAFYLEGGNGVLTNPAEPTLPLEVRNVSVPDLVLRGVGLRGGSYSDRANILPLIGAPTTEIRGVHAPFLTATFYPIRPWNVNYFEALDGGATRLMLAAAQFQSDASGFERGVLRQFNQMSFRLYYSNNISTYGDGSIPALAAAPTIARVSGVPGNDNVNFKVSVVGNPAAGIQEVWVTWTDISNPAGGTWQSLDLAQNASDSTLWTGTLPLNGVPAANVRYIVQAVNGVGLVGLATNLGAYYVPGVEASPNTPTRLAFQSPPDSGVYGAQTSFSVALTDASDQPLAGQRVVISLGAQGRQAITDDSGRATADFPLLGLPGTYEVSAIFGGTSVYQPALATSTFSINKQATRLSLELQSSIVLPGADSGVVATLQDAGGRFLGEKTVCFVVGVYGRCVITDYAGRAPLGRLPLPGGSYTINAYFAGSIPLPGTPITVIDERYQPSTATTSLVLNTSPQAVDDAYSVDEDNSLNVAAPGVLGNDLDADGNVLTAALVSVPSAGSLSLESSGAFLYTPPLDFNGLVFFSYTATDGIALSTATVTITVNAVNDSPLAADDAYTVDGGSTLNVTAPGVLGNDSDVEGDALTAILVSPPAHGDLTLNADGSFSYTPGTGFGGSDSFTYLARDTGNADSNTATVTIAVNLVNQAPDCSTAAASPLTLWPPDKNFWPVSVVGVADPDGDPVTITITGIRQDEPTGNTEDGHILGLNAAELRAERDGKGDGRVYHLLFTTEDGRGGVCSGKVRAAVVPHDQGGNLDAVDQGPRYDSTVRSK